MRVERSFLVRSFYEILIGGGRHPALHSLHDSFNSLIDCVSEERLECSFIILCDHHWFYSVAMSSVSFVCLLGVPLVVME